MKNHHLRRIAYCLVGIGFAYLAWARFDRSVEINREFHLDGQELAQGITLNAFVIGDWKFRRETWCHVAEYSPPYSLYFSIESFPNGTASFEIVRAQIEEKTGGQDVTHLLIEQVVDLLSESPKKTFCFKDAILFHKDFKLLLEYRTSLNGQTKTEWCSLQLRATESRHYNSLFLRRICYLT